VVAFLPSASAFAVLGIDGASCEGDFEVVLLVDDEVVVRVETEDRQEERALRPAIEDGRPVARLLLWDDEAPVWLVELGEVETGVEIETLSCQETAAHDRAGSEASVDASLRRQHSHGQGLHATAPADERDLARPSGPPPSGDRTAPNDSRAVVPWPSPGLTAAAFAFLALASRRWLYKSA